MNEPTTYSLYSLACKLAYHDPHFHPAQVQSNCPAQLGGGPCEEHFFAVLGDVVEYNCCRQGVSMDNSYFHVWVFLHK